MNILGTRAGVGGVWCDKNDMSASLRQRTIHNACKDVRASLISCCGMAIVYGLSALAIGVATGITAQADLTGGAITEDKKLLQIPPVGVVLEQQMIQKKKVTSDGEPKKICFIKRETFAVACSVDENAATLKSFVISSTVESPSSIPTRTGYKPVEIKMASSEGTPEQHHDNGDERAAKRSRLGGGDDDDEGILPTTAHSKNGSIAGNFLGEVDALARSIAIALDE